MSNGGSGSRTWGYLSHTVAGRRLPRLLWSAIRTIIGSSREITSVLLVFLSLAIAVWSIEQANWIRPQPSLITVLFLAVLTGLLLFRSRLPARITYPVMIVLGLGVTVWQAVSLMPLSDTESAFRAWWVAVSGIRPSEGTTYFAMFLCIVVWIIGYISTWYVLRKRNVWVAVGLGTLAVLINLSNLPREDYLFLPFYLITAMLLIGQVNLAKQGIWFGRRYNNFPRRGVLYLVTATLCISVLTVITAWFVPQPSVDQLGLASFGGTLNGDAVRGQWFNIFADVRSKWTQISSSEQQTLSFSDPLSTSKRIQFVVSADRPAYWRVRRYDTYQSWGWSSSEISNRQVGTYEEIFESDGYEQGEQLTYTVENKLKTDIVLVAGELLSADMPVVLQTFTDEEPDVDQTVLFSGQTDREENVQPQSGDVIAVITPRAMKPYQKYEAVVNIRSFTPDELSAAGDNYPDAIRERYLQLPNSLPWPVRRLAREITLNAESPYEKVLAVKEYINKLEYNLEADVPPETTDAVYYFLFASREGVCTSFASAMAIMLRIVDIPTRLNTGYLEGDYDEETGTYILRVSDYHARTEVYFPEYGWVEFSATPVGGSTDDIVEVGDDTGMLEILDPMLMIIPDENSIGPAGGDFTRSNLRGNSLPGPQIYVYFIIIGIPVLLFFAARVTYAMWLQRLKHINSPADAYRKMSKLAALGKMGPLEHETPLEYCARLILALPLQAELISAITGAYVETQFSPRKELGRLQQGRLQKTWVELVPSLTKKLPRLRTRPD